MFEVGDWKATNDIFCNVLLDSCLCFMGFLRFTSKWRAPFRGLGWSFRMRSRGTPLQMSFPKYGNRFFGGGWKPWVTVETSNQV